MYKKLSPIKLLVLILFTFFNVNGQTGKIACYVYRIVLGDEVIVPSNTYIASILAISYNNLNPILVEPSYVELENKLKELNFI